MHIDWFGPAEELKQIDEAQKKACAKTDGVDYKGRYTPSQKKTHWTYLLFAENYAKYGEYRDNLSIDRDYKKWPYATVEFYPGPFDK